MSSDMKTIDISVERTIHAAPDRVFDAWLDPVIPGTPWHEADRLLLNPAVDGFFYWLIRGTAHYGRFTALDRGSRIQHTWVSPNTLGFESTVTVTFRKQGGDTVMTLVHTGLPDTNQGRGHEGGWNYFMGNFEKQFAPAASTTR